MSDVAYPKVEFINSCPVVKVIPVMENPADPGFPSNFNLWWNSLSYFLSPSLSLWFLHLSFSSSWACLNSFPHCIRVSKPCGKRLLMINPVQSFELYECCSSAARFRALLLRLKCGRARYRLLIFICHGPYVCLPSSLSLSFSIKLSFSLFPPLALEYFTFVIPLLLNFLFCVLHGICSSWN